MSDHNRPRARLLDLIAEPGVVEILLALHEHDGAATLAQLRAAGVAHRSHHLRRLIAGGYVYRLGSGTLDIEPAQGATFSLTPTGQGIVTTLLKISRWGEQPSRDQD